MDSRSKSSFVTLILAGIVALLVPLLASADEKTEKIKVLASIRPLALIVDSIAGDLAEVEVLLTGASSPHHYSMKFSDKKKIHSSDLVVWVGPLLEIFLADSLEQKPELHMTHNGHLEYDHHKEVHPWLNPSEVAIFSKHITKYLINVFPAKETQLKQNLKAFLTRQELAVSNTRQRLKNLKTEKFVSYHAGFQEVVTFYKLNLVTALTSQPQEQIGTRTLYTLKLHTQEARCLLAEEGEVNKAKGYAKLLGLSVVTIDILASSTDIHSYNDFQLSLAGQLVHCLKG